MRTIRARDYPHSCTRAVTTNLFLPIMPTSARYSRCNFIDTRSFDDQFRLSLIVIPSIKDSGIRTHGIDDFGESLHGAYCTDLSTCFLFYPSLFIRISLFSGVNEIRIRWEARRLSTRVFPRKFDDVQRLTNNRPTLKILPVNVLARTYSTQRLNLQLFHTCLTLPPLGEPADMSCRMRTHASILF